MKPEGPLGVNRQLVTIAGACSCGLGLYVATCVSSKAPPTVSCKRTGWNRYSEFLKVIGVDFIIMWLISVARFDSDF